MTQVYKVGHTKPLGYILNLTDGSMCHLVYPGARVSFAFPVGHVWELIADGKCPHKEFKEQELESLALPEPKSED